VQENDVKSSENERKNQPKSPFLSYFSSKNKKANKNNGFPVILVIDYLQENSSL